MSKLRGLATNVIMAEVGLAIGSLGKSVNHHDNSHCFFRPYQSPSDFLTRTIAIATTPILGAVHVAGMVVELAIQLIQGVINLITFNFSGAAESFLAMGVILLSTLAAVPIYAVSPVIELVDLVGGGINSCLCASS